MNDHPNRRRFLKQLLATGSIAWLTSGDASAKPLHQGYSNPVAFTQNPFDPSSPGNLDQTIFQINAASDPAAVFTLGVASGDPRPHGIVLWTHISERVAVPKSVVAYEVARDSSFSVGSTILQGVATLESASDYTVKLPIENQVLRPFTTYYYRFIYNQHASRVGRFKTLPEPGANLERIRFAYVSCQDFSNGYYTALKFLAQEDVDFVVHLGDYIYETIDDPSFQGAQVRPVPPFPSGFLAASSLADYRHLYRTYKSDPNLQAVHENFAFIQLWDDHEFANDSYGELHPDNNPTPPGLRQAANQAWSEYGLADVEFKADKDPRDSIQVYRSFRFGNLMELVVTDERLYRDGPPCGDETFERYLTKSCANVNNPERTMLGDTQRDWFIDTLGNSKATWKVWANEVMLMQVKIINTYGLTPARYLNLDMWDGYPVERRNILTTLRDKKVRNLIAITGDIHSFGAGYLKTNFDNLFSVPVGVEFVVGSVTSGNLVELATSQVPLSSAPIPQEVFDISSDVVEAVVRVSNPHIAYFNSSTHGYSLLELTPKEATCTMKSVSTIRSPGASLSVLKTFRVPVNQAKLLSKNS